MPELEEESDELADVELDTLVEETPEEALPELEEESDELADVELDTLVEETPEDGLPELEEESDELADDDLEMHYLTKHQKKLCQSWKKNPMNWPTTISMH
ncbi:hypothetical protein PNC201_05495 [Pseudoalteromonas sp. NC201]|nr:hypothetical protein PNC201_05495 [Pseudoalteromonas sp. NC201]